MSDSHAYKAAVPFKCGTWHREYPGKGKGKMEYESWHVISNNVAL